MSDNPHDTWVTITHPDIAADGGPVTQAALESVWAPLGWVAADSGDEPGADPNDPAAEPPETVRSIDG